MTKKGLVVEDDLILAMISCKYLEKMGCAVVASVCSGKGAVEAVAKYLPDFILMDIRLDGPMDGIEAMEEIRKFSAVPVVYISGNSEPRVRSRAEATGMIAFLVKPLDYGDLKQLIDKI
jgi:CheY-like chemotaxis protein